MEQCIHIIFKIKGKTSGDKKKNLKQAKGQIQ